MKSRSAGLSHMRDLLENMNESYNRIVWAGGEGTETYFAVAFIKDLEQCRRVCAELRARIAAS